MIIIGVQLFIRWITIFRLISIQFFNRTMELRYFKEVDRFSFIEAYTLSKTVQAFHSYKFDTLEFSLSDGSIRVVFRDEKAHISYLLDKPLYAELNYDLVFDSTINYAFIEDDEASWIDKQGD